MSLLPELNSSQINHEFRLTPSLHPFYIPAAPKDELYKAPLKHSFGLVNNDNHTGPGTHWVCFYSCPNQPTIICFDSMGAPPNQNLTDHCEALSKVLHKPVTYSTCQLQELGTSSCGWFCIYVLKKLLQGERIQTILKEFSGIPSQDEQYLYRQFQKYHNSTPSSKLPFVTSPSKKASSPRGKGLSKMPIRQKSKHLQRKKQMFITPSAGIPLKAAKRRTPLAKGAKLPLARNPIGLLTNNVVRLPRPHAVPPPFNPLGLLTNNIVRVSPYIPTPSS